MITRDDIRELANFQSPEGCAVTFYYEPSTPLNKSHREEAILVKDLIRNALREAEKRGKNGSTRTDLEKINGIVDPLLGNGGKAKAIFAYTVFLGHFYIATANPGIESNDPAGVRKT